MSSSFAPRDGKCDSCGLTRSLKDGICHECEVNERDACPCVECTQSQEACICEGGPWIPGGYQL